MPIRYKLTVEYDGFGFVGMQRQNNGLSIQEVIEIAIKKFSGEDSVIYAAGRTDSGVHALAQVVHFDINKMYKLNIICSAINHFVKPHKIVVIRCTIENHEFHARFSAKSRSYKYIIVNRESPLVLMQNRAWHVSVKLDTEKMDDAAKVMIGKNDLSSFRSSQCQSKSAIKSISDLRVKKISEDYIEIFIKAPSFLHNQVRIIVGCLKKVGEGKWSKEDLNRVLQAKDRRQASITAPAYGLYFYEVNY
jgi:tRNA pseudouridine38-40 synthase